MNIITLILQLVNSLNNGHGIGHETLHVLFFVLNYTVQYLNLLINIRINTNTNKKYFYIMIKNLYRRSTGGWKDSILILSSSCDGVCVCVYMVCVFAGLQCIAVSCHPVQSTIKSHWLIIKVKWLSSFRP